MSSSPLNVLVVDDEDIIRYLCTSALSEAGHSSIAVEDGSSALKALDKERFDSILLDMAFVGPPMGRELYERIIDKHPFMKGLSEELVNRMAEHFLCRFLMTLPRSLMTQW